MSEYKRVIAKMWKVLFNIGSRIFPEPILTPVQIVPGCDKIDYTLLEICYLLYSVKYYFNKHVFQLNDMPLTRLHCMPLTPALPGFHKTLSLISLCSFAWLAKRHGMTPGCGACICIKAGGSESQFLPRPPVVVTLTFPSHAELIA